MGKKEVGGNRSGRLEWVEAGVGGGGGAQAKKSRVELRRHSGGVERRVFGVVATPGKALWPFCPSLFLFTSFPSFLPHSTHHGPYWGRGRMRAGQGSCELAAQGLGLGLAGARCMCPWPTCAERLLPCAGWQTSCRHAPL